uniref:Uncharacterized protein n=1 Tax=Populus alba TaxID=43335 RepID=A0A4U5PMK4_POPAL|nr:hypothetical protein D5086_0000205250 [Populus alba]
MAVDPSSYHESSEQRAEPASTFYLINASLPEVGDQPGSIPWRHHDPHDPDADETRAETARKSFYRARAARTGRSQGRRPPRRHRVPHPKARATARGPVRRIPLDWNTGAAARFGPARPRGGARRRGTASHSNSPNGYAAQEPRLAARHPGPWAESDGGSRPTVRCTSTEPADTDSPITAHATLRTRDNNPDERTTATRANGNTRERSCPHRWTRKDLEGTSNM